MIGSVIRSSFKICGSGLAAAQIATDLLMLYPPTRVDLRCHEKRTAQHAQTSKREIHCSMERLLGRQVLEVLKQGKPPQVRDCRSQVVVRPVRDRVGMVCWLADIEGSALSR
jgi:hypothetical protein